MDSAQAPPSAGDTTTMSGPGALLSKLKQLQQSDPAKFKEVMSTIAGKLKDASDASTDPQEKKALADLSTKFDAAGQSGDLSGLAPTKHKGGHHHHRRASDAPPADATATATATASATPSASPSASASATASASQAYQQVAGTDPRAIMQETMSKLAEVLSTAGL